MIGVFGDLVLDVTVLPHGPLRPRSDVSGQISCRGGGSAANVATWLGWLGSPVRFAAAVGRDLLARNLAAELEQFGVELFLVEKPEPTGVILLFLDEQRERTMITSRGANLLLKPEDLPESFFAGLGHVHITGYSLFGSAELANTTAHILAQIKRRGLSFSVDPSSYALLEEFGPQRFLAMTAGANLVFPNLDEGRVLSGAQEPEAIVQELLRYYPRVVLTLGAMGCLWGDGKELKFTPAETVEPVDTTGAGDAFAAGFLHEFCRGADMASSALKGVQTAASCIGGYGGRPRLDPKT